MPIYLSLLRYTQQGITKIKDIPARDSIVWKTHSICRLR